LAAARAASLEDATGADFDSLKRLKSARLASSFRARAAAVSKLKPESEAGAFVALREVLLLSSRLAGGETGFVLDPDE